MLTVSYSSIRLGRLTAKGDAASSASRRIKSRVGLRVSATLPFRAPNEKLTQSRARLDKMGRT
jgi:hypothetical protein